MAKSYALRPLSEQERAAYDGFTHIAVIQASDLTTAVNNTAQTFNHGVVPAGAQVRVDAYLHTPFENTADAAFNTTAITVGDGSSAAAFLASTELNKNGTTVTYKAGSISANYTADASITTTVNAMSAKKLSDINKGAVIILAKVIDFAKLAKLKLVSDLR